MPKHNTSAKMNDRAPVPPERDYADGISPGLVPYPVEGWCLTSVYAYGYEQRAQIGKLINADAADQAEQLILESAEVTVFIYLHKEGGDELLILRGDYNDGDADIYAFEHADGSEWVNASVPCTIAGAHARLRSGQVRAPFGIVHVGPRLAREE